MHFIRAIKTGVRKNSRPGKPLLPVGARTEIDPLVIPLFGIRMTAIVVDLPRREQQDIAGAADELLVAILDDPLSAHGQVEDIPFHPERSVDVKIEISLSLDRGQPCHKVRVKRVSRQQGIVLRFGHRFSSPNGPEGNQLSISLKAGQKWSAKRSRKHHASFTSAMFQPFPLISPPEEADKQ